MSEQKTIDVINQKPIKSKSGIYIGSDCVVPSIPLAQSFCEGFNSGIDHIIRLASLNSNDHKYLCQIVAQPPTITSESLNLPKNPFIDDALIDHEIIISKFDKQKGNIQEIKRFKSTRDEGIKDKDQKCMTSNLVESDKFCKGYDLGVKTIIENARLDEKVYKSNCKKEIKQADDDKVLYGTLRVV